MKQERISFLAYDTACQISVMVEDGYDSASLLEGAKSIALEVESTLSMFDEQSELSNGAFDPTVGPLVRMWNFLADKPSVPDSSALEAILGRVGYTHVKMHP